MCGRYGSKATGAEMRMALALSASPPEIRPRYNIAPTQKALVVNQTEGGRLATLMRWGIQLPPKPDGRKRPPIFNIRAETLLSSGLWKSRLQRSRLVAPADWFYEWIAGAGTETRQPVLIRRRDGASLFFAALAARSDHAEGELAYTLITVESSPALAHIHHRWPVCLDPDSVDVWLDPETRLEALAELLAAPSADLFEQFAVSDLVNRVVNDSPDLIKPLGA